MKKLIVFYSRTGTTRKLAEKIASELDSDIEEIIDLTERKGATGWLKSGRDAMRKKLTNINDLKNGLKNYELIVVGSPVWVGSLTPAIRTFLLNNKNNIKKAAFFCTMGGNNPSKIFDQMEELINLKPLSILALTTKEVINDLGGEKIESFVKIIKKS